MHSPTRAAPGPFPPKLYEPFLLDVVSEAPADPSQTPGLSLALGGLGTIFLVGSIAAAASNEHLQGDVAHPLAFSFVLFAITCLVLAAGTYSQRISDHAIASIWSFMVSMVPLAFAVVGLVATHEDLVAMRQREPPTRNIARVRHFAIGAATAAMPRSLAWKGAVMGCAAGALLVACTVAALRLDESAGWLCSLFLNRAVPLVFGFLFMHPYQLLHASKRMVRELEAARRVALCSRYEAPNACDAPSSHPPPPPPPWELVTAIGGQGECQRPSNPVTGEAGSLAQYPESTSSTAVDSLVGAIPAGVALSTASSSGGHPPPIMRRGCQPGAFAAGGAGPMPPPSQPPGPSPPPSPPPASPPPSPPFQPAPGSTFPPQLYEPFLLNVVSEAPADPLAAPLAAPQTVRVEGTSPSPRHTAPISSTLTSQLTPLGLGTIFLVGAIVSSAAHVHILGDDRTYPLTSGRWGLLSPLLFAITCLVLAAGTYSQRISDHAIASIWSFMVSMVPLAFAVVGLVATHEDLVAMRQREPPTRNIARVRHFAIGAATAAMPRSLAWKGAVMGCAAGALLVACTVAALRLDESAGWLCSLFLNRAVPLVFGFLLMHRVQVVAASETSNVIDPRRTVPVFVRTVPPLSGFMQAVYGRCSRSTEDGSSDATSTVPSCVPRDGSNDRLAALVDSPDSPGQGQPPIPSHAVPPLSGVMHALYGRRVQLAEDASSNLARDGSNDRLALLVEPA